MRLLLATLLLLLIVGCTVSQPAPIVEGWHQPEAQNSDYIVQKGDTLYSVAWAFNMDFRDLAKINNIPVPYSVHRGQRLRMAPSFQTAAPRLITFLETPTISNTKNIPNIRIHQLPHPATKVVKLPTVKLPVKTATRSYSKIITPVKIKPANVAKQTIANKSFPYRLRRVKDWLFPAKGKIVRGFSLVSGGNRGIEIAGLPGEPVVASASGKVVYSGSGLRGYGNLIIIKHNDTFLSAYAYNKKLLVKEGMNVTAGQKIALMGTNNAGQPRLHFEIRRNGKPIDPLKLVG